MECNKCGNIIPKDSEFCPECGYKATIKKIKIKNLIKTICCKIYIIIFILAVVFQLLYVPHRIYNVVYLPERDTQYVFNYIEYGILTKNFFQKDKWDLPITTSKIAYDIIILDVFATLLISFSGFVLTYKKPNSKYIKTTNEQE